MKVAPLLLLPAAASAFTSSDVLRATSARCMSDEAAEPEAVVAAPAAPAGPTALEDLEALSVGLNPTIGFYDPLSLADADFWNQGDEATIGFLRHAEIKHGRVAMAAFVGYCVQSNFVWPWANTLAGAPFPSTDLSPEAQWDALPGEARWQIILVVGFLEIWDEVGGGDPDRKHYMRGGKPGDYPTFQNFRDEVHWVLDLYDPFGFTKRMTQEKKDRRLLIEINNGRLAMLGIFGFLAADAVPGSVPALVDKAIPYDGNVMAPFASDGSFFAPVESISNAVTTVAEASSPVI